MTKISNCPHKDELCLISLTTDLRKKMTNKGCDPDDAIKKLKDIGVDVCDLTIQSLSKINQYRLVIIICHHIQSQDIDALVLSDNTLLPVDVFVNAISKEFTGLLDLAICQSKEMAYAIKALSKFSDSIRIQYAEDETDVEFRLCYIYPDLLKYFSFDPIENYRERYRNTYLGAIELAEREQKERGKDINSLPEGTKLGESSESSNDSVNTSVFMPEKVTRGEFFQLQIKMHLDINTGTLYFDDAKGNDPNTAQRKKNVAIKDINKGDELLLNLCFLDGDSAPIPTEQIKIKKELNKEELNSIHNIYTLWITISEENQTLVLYVKIANEYSYSKFFTIIEFVKDGKPLIEPFILETEFKIETNHYGYDKDRQQGNNYGKPYNLSQGPGLYVPANLPAKLSRAQAEKLYNSLKNKEFIGADATLNSWLHVVGCQKAQIWKPITWIKTKECLRLLLYGIYEEELTKKEFPKKFIIESVPHCFKDSKGNAMQLANAKKEVSEDADFIIQQISELKMSEE